MSGVCKECNRLVEPASKPRWEHYEDKLKLIEYIKLHIISLEQDAEKIRMGLSDMNDWDSDEFKNLEIEEIYTNGQLIASRHLLSVVADILGIELKEK